MSQMFISPLVIRAYRTLDGLESYDQTETEVEWYVINTDTGSRIAGPYTSYEAALPALRAQRKRA